MNWRCNHTSVITLISWIPENQCKIPETFWMVWVPFRNFFATLYTAWKMSKYTLRCSPNIACNFCRNAQLSKKNSSNWTPCAWNLFCKLSSMCLTSSTASPFVIFHVTTYPAEFNTQNSPLYCFTQLSSVCLTKPILRTDLNVWSQLNQGHRGGRVVTAIWLW